MLRGKVGVLVGCVCLVPVNTASSPVYGPLAHAGPMTCTWARRHVCGQRRPRACRGLKDKTCWFYGDFSAFWCGKIGIEVGGSQLGGWTKRVGFVATFRLAGAGKAALKLVVSSWGYEYPQMPGVRANDDQVWTLSVRGAAMALHPVQDQPGQPH